MSGTGTGTDTDIGIGTDSGSESKRKRKDKTATRQREIRFRELYRYATASDWLLIGLATLLAFLKSLVHPIAIVVYSELVALFIDRNLGVGTSSMTYALPLFGGGKLLTNATHEENMAELRNDSMAFGILVTLDTLLMFFTGIAYVDLFNHVALKLVVRMRRKFFEATLRQDIGWHDVAQDQNFALRITDNMEKIRNGISENVGHFLQLVCDIFISIAISFAYGWKLTLANCYYIPITLAINIIVTKVVSGIIVGADHISRTAPFLETFAMARGAAVAIFEVLDAASAIDPLAPDGKILNTGLRGHIEFRDVFFQYPSRDDAVVLRGFNLTVRAGQTVALVGHSGSGKSTCIQLLQRFYDPTFGKLLLDDEDLRHYNVAWLRSNVAVVGQEPILFQGTIGENIRHGKPCATQKEVEDAARAAGAHDFIIALPQSYSTAISEKGAQLSGGQKQRIAIARALIQDPKILLLDEATSALDYHSEKLVQAALDRASKGRTTLVVSHRLSAICHADHIVFIESGQLAEQGSHEELMRRRGRYFEMVSAHGYTGSLEELAAGSGELAELGELGELGKLGEPGPLDPRDRRLSHDGDKVAHDFLRPRFSQASIDKNIANMLDFNKPTAAALSSRAEETANAAGKETRYVQTFGRIVRWAKPEWGFLVLGTICAGIYGCTQPAFSMVYAELYAALAHPDDGEVLRRTSFVAIVSTAVGVTAAVVCYTQTYFFNLAGVWLTTRIRGVTFKAIMRQDMGWFDEKDNSVGALSARLAGDASSVQGAIGFPLSNIIQALTNFICSISIAFYYSWELALVCLCTAPFMVASIVFEARYITKSAVKEKEVLEETSRIATEGIAQIRTVAALRREPGLIAAYDAEVERYVVQIKRRLRFRGLVNSLGMSMMFLGYALTLTYGGYMCADGKIQFEDIMKISNTMLYGLFILAQSLAFTPAFNAAIISANRLHQIISREPTIKSPDVYSLQLNGGKLAGKGTDEGKGTGEGKGKLNAIQGVSYRDIHFSYPTPRNLRVLRGLDLDVLQGRTVALVGASGCGKSTCVQLIQRYYDPDAGKILIDQEDIHRDVELPTLRRRLGIVSQEPALFEKTIAENIAYGDNSRPVPLAQIVDAAKMANAHEFITALPAGYETCLGARGTQLSGGQKQRIAIARALVRNPKILLLDEATSALDLQSERVVQQALDEACHGRTCIVIAHRLATVQNADLICVLQGGRIAEQGSHPQLLAQDGIYAKLYRSQPNCVL